MADSLDIIGRMSQFMADRIIRRETPDTLTRDIGGHKRQNQPYISGYFQVFFRLPSAIFTTEKEGSELWLHSTVESFTPHTEMVTAVEVFGQGQRSAKFPANVTVTREFTVMFREYQNMPILNIIKRWAGAIYNPTTGVSSFKGADFVPVNYKGVCIYIQTKPVKFQDQDFELEKDDIEQAYIYQGVFPTTIPVDTASASDIMGNDTIQESVTFSFDGDPLDLSYEPVFDYIKEVWSNRSYYQTYSQYVIKGLDRSA